MSKPRRHQKQLDAAIFDAWSANKTPSDKAAWPLARNVSRTGMQIYPRAPSNPGHRGFHRSRRSVRGSILAVCDSLGFLLAIALGLDVSCGIALASSLDRGWRRTAAIGVFGATAAAGKLIGLMPEQIPAAFDIAYSHAVGNRQYAS
jgi:hypothetical protein